MASDSMDNIVHADNNNNNRPSSLYMDLKELRKRFDEVDTERNGYIDYEGLQEMISTMDGFDSYAVQGLMNTLDRDGDGKVTFEDFQVVFTLERDAVKAEQRQQYDYEQNDSHSSNSSAYTTALYSQTSPESNYLFSPERPGAPHGNRTGHRTKRTPNRLTQVPDSPDLSMHVRSLQKPATPDHSDYSQCLSLSSEHGDQVLEDTGTVGATLPSPFVSPAPNTFMGLELIDKELHSICKNDIVNREDIVQLCNRLGVDGKDEQEFLDLWDELMTISNDTITVDIMYQSIKQRETIAMVTSTPANINQQLSIKQAWKKHRDQHVTMQSFETHSQDEIHSQNDSLEEEERDESSDEFEHRSEWVDGGNFPFHETPHSSVVRPSSAREGSRLSRGQSESSLRQTATMQKFYYDHKKLQEDLEQVKQERDILKANLARVENEKKQLIQEGDESVINIQRQKDATIRKLESEFFSKQRSLETSLSIDHQGQRESLEMEINKLREKLNTIKTEIEALKEDLKYYQSDNEKLVDSVDQLHNKIAIKDEKIYLLQEKLGMPSDSLSESDMELHTSRLHELENSIQVYMDHNEDLRKQNTELQDKVDELMVECEKIKQKYMEEKRKRQRKTSEIAQPQTTKSRHRSRHSRSSKSGRQLPQGLPIPNRTHGQIEEDHEMTDSQTGGDTSELWMISDEDSTNYTASIDDDQLVDDIAAQSSTSLLEEIKASDEQQLLLTRISELQNHSSSLEKTCADLQAQLNTLEESKVALRNKLEQELRQKMFQKTNLDNRLKQLNVIRKELAIARKSVTDKILTSEEILARYLHSLETDINQLFAKDAANEIDIIQQLTEEISILKTQAHENGVTIEKGNEEIMKLQEYMKEQRLQLDDLQDSNGKLQDIVEQQSSRIIAMVTDGAALQNQSNHVQTRLESQERELKRTRNESRLAIHDLAKKDEECNIQYDKVTKLENELIRLHGNNDQLQMSLDEKESEIISLINANNEMEDKLNSALEGLRFQSPEVTSVSPLISLRVFSPDQSYSSSVGQTDILHQMKNQLEQLHEVLIEKTGEEGSEIELSFVQELLQMNTSLEGNLLNQHQAYDQLIMRKDDQIKELEDLLADRKAEQSHGIVGDIEVLQREVASLQNYISELKRKVEKSEEVCYNLEDELKKEKKNGKFQKVIIDKQIEEIIKLNHYFGKARSKEIDLDTKKEKMDVQIKQQENEIMNQSLRIKELESTSQSVLEHKEFLLGADNETELLTIEESLHTAEQMISSYRNKVLNLYQYVIKPSDSKASDILEFSEMIAHLKETFDTINDELTNEKEAQENLHASLLTHSDEYDALYSEHDEEVRAIKQQRDSLLRQMTEMEKRFQDAITGQINAFTLEQTKAKDRTNDLIMKVQTERNSLQSVFEETKSERDSLEIALEQANDKIDDLSNSKAILIKLIQNISLQTLSSLTIE